MGIRYRLRERLRSGGRRQRGQAKGAHGSKFETQDQNPHSNPGPYAPPPPPPFFPFFSRAYVSLVVFRSLSREVTSPDSTTPECPPPPPPQPISALRASFAAKGPGFEPAFSLLVRWYVGDHHGLLAALFYFSRTSVRPTTKMPPLILPAQRHSWALAAAGELSTPTCPPKTRPKQGLLVVSLDDLPKKLVFVCGPEIPHPVLQAS